MSVDDFFQRYCVERPGLASLFASRLAGNSQSLDSSPAEVLCSQRWETPGPYKKILELARERDKPALNRAAEKLIDRRSELSVFVANLDQWLSRISQSVETVRSRESLLKRATIQDSLNTDLPIQAHLEEIASYVEKHQVVIVAGETGSGKTTQLPKLLARMGYGCKGRIGHTQPRRLAARTVAARIAEELETPLGTGVGYRFRFESNFGDQSRILLMTDGLLLSEIERDRQLLEYDALIIDEAHERSLNIDFLLGYLKTLLKKRPDFKLIVTSATIDVERFAAHFDGAPVVHVEGRSYPVAIEYPESSLWGGGEVDENGMLGLDAAADETFESVEVFVSRILSRIEEGERSGDYSRAAADVLVFLPGEREIRDLRQQLQRLAGDDPRSAFEILPLYARLGREEQSKLFGKGSQKRRVVLATNVAETSVTVPNIGYVIDTGVARISRYSFNSRLQRLQIEKISQASAAQRAGRCGRVADGVCFRLFTQADFEGRPEFTDPEITRTQLAEVILKMQMLRLGDINHFPFIERPGQKQIRNGINTLRELGAIDEEDARRANQASQGFSITRRGRALARLPIDPALGAVLLSAQRLDCLSEMLVIVSALGVVDPREYPEKKKQHAEQLHARFKDKRSDFLSYLNLWVYLEAHRRSLSSTQFRKLCKREYFSWIRIREWRNTYRQLKLILDSKTELDFALHTSDEDACRIDWTSRYELIHRCLIAGLYQKFGRLEEDGSYRGARNARFFIAPGSAGFRSRNRWVLASEIVETRKVYGRVVAAIKREWLAQELGHLLKYEYGDPVWNKSRGQVLLPRTSRLFGVVVASNETVPCERVDEPLAREIFIREALARRDLGGDRRVRTALLFWQRNEAILDKLSAIEDRLRSRDESLGERFLESFYETRLPAGVVSRHSLQKAFSSLDKDSQNRLLLSEEDIPLLKRAAEAAGRFPSELTIDNESYKLQYSFAPGAASDGVTCVIPETDLHGLEQEVFEWLVPGLLQEKVAAMLKLLPKQIRRKLVPIPTHSEQLVAMAEAKRSELKGTKVPSLYKLLQQLMLAHYRVEVDPVAWRAQCEESLDRFYFMRISVVDERGKRLTDGRQIARAKASIAEQARDSDKSVSEAPHEDVSVYRSWCFERIGQAVKQTIDGKLMRVYPVMKPVGDGVVKGYELDSRHAAMQNREGILRLATIKLGDANRYLKKQLYRDEKKLLGFSISTESESFSKSLLVESTIKAAIAASCFGGFSSAEPATNEEFASSMEAGRANVVETALQIEAVLFECATEYRILVSALAEKEKHFTAQHKDINAQLNLLLENNFIVDTPLTKLRQLPRYLRAVNVRLDRLGGNYKKDNEYCEKLSTYQQNLQQLLYKYPEALNFDASLVEFRWMLEELRVALFAQQLKTATPASFKRLDACWDRVDMLLYS